MNTPKYEDQIEAALEAMRAKAAGRDLAPLSATTAPSLPRDYAPRLRQRSRLAHLVRAVAYISLFVVLASGAAYVVLVVIPQYWR